MSDKKKKRIQELESQLKEKEERIKELNLLLLFKQLESQIIESGRRIREIMDEVEHAFDTFDQRPW